MEHLRIISVNEKEEKKKWSFGQSSERACSKPKPGKRFWNFSFRCASKNWFNTSHTGRIKRENYRL